MDYLFQAPQSESSFSLETLVLPQTNKLFEEILINNNKNYLCLFPDCGKTFKFKSEMKRHLAVHSNRRPFQCTFPGCGKTFKRDDALDYHVKTHTSKALFQCNEEGCNTQFTSKSALRYHLLKHTGEKIFRCEVAGCSKSFLTYAQLKQHEKGLSHHKKLLQGENQLFSQQSPNYSSKGSSLIGESQDTDFSVNNNYEFDFENIDFNIDQFLNSQDQYPMINHAPSHLEKSDHDVVETTQTSAPRVERSLDDQFLSMIQYMEEENKELRKKVKYTTDTLEQKLAQNTQPKEEIDIDLFFGSEIIPTFGHQDSFGGFLNMF